MADPEAKSARLSRDLAGLLDLEQRVELAPSALGVPCFEHGAREVEPNDRGTARDDCRLIARDRIRAVTACVQSRGVRRVELPARGSGRDGSFECRAARLEIAALERDDRSELLRGGVRIARRSDTAQVRERRPTGAGIRVQLGEPHDLGVGERMDRMGVLEGDDRLVDVTALRAKLGEDVMRAPGAWLDHGEVLQRAHLSSAVVPLERLGRENEEPLFGGGAVSIRGDRRQIALERATDRLVRTAGIALTQQRRSDLLVHAFQKRRVRGLVRRGGRVGSPRSPLPPRARASARARARPSQACPGSIAIDRSRGPFPSRRRRAWPRGGASRRPRDTCRSARTPRRATVRIPPRGRRPEMSRRRDIRPRSWPRASRPGTPAGRRRPRRGRSARPDARPAGAPTRPRAAWSRARRTGSRRRSGARRSRRQRQRMRQY